MGLFLALLLVTIELSTLQPPTETKKPHFFVHVFYKYCLGTYLCVSLLKCVSMEEHAVSVSSPP